MLFLKIFTVIAVFCISFTVLSIVGVLFFCTVTGIKLGHVSESDEWSKYGLAVTLCILVGSWMITKEVYWLLMALAL